MPPVWFEPTISAGERPKNYALDRAATNIPVYIYKYIYIYLYIFFTMTQQPPVGHGLPIVEDSDHTQTHHTR